MSKRAKDMFVKLNLKFPEKKDDEIPNAQPPGNRVEDVDELGSVTESERGVLSSEYVQTWLNRKCVQDKPMKKLVDKPMKKSVDKPMKTSVEPLTPMKDDNRGLPTLVDYSPASSTISNSSNIIRIENKENALDSAHPSKRTSLLKRKSLEFDCEQSVGESGSCVAPPTKIKTLETAIDQNDKSDKAASGPAKLCAYTLMKMKNIQEMSEILQKDHGLKIDTSEMIFCMNSAVDEDSDEMQNDVVEERFKGKNSDTSDEFSPSTSEGSSSSSDSDLSPPSKKKGSRSAPKRKSPKARKGLRFASQSSTGFQSGTSAPEVTVNQKCNKEKPVPPKKPLSLQRKMVNSSKQVHTPKKTAGNQLFGSNSPEPTCSARLMTPAAHNVECVETDSLENVETDQSSTNVLDNGELDEVYNDTAEPLSEDDLQDLRDNNDKPPSKKALKKERKHLRDSGKKYQTPKGKTVAKREPKPIHNCSTLKCQDHISKEGAATLCENYWNLASHDKQSQYVSSLIEYDRPMRRRIRDEDSNKNRKVTFRYYLDVEGKRIRVCKSTFLGTLCISETFVRNITNKKLVSPGSLIPEDGRGHHQPKHSLSEEKKQAVMAHIESFPSYVSHYSRSQTKSLYFPSNLSYKKMYRLYKKTKNPHVSYSAYKRLAKKTGKKFKKNSKDQCGKCERLKIQIALKEGEEKRKSEIELEVHHRKAEEAYAVKRKLKKEASTTDNMRVLVYDLEQCLPTPMLRCGESYYTRQLNTFNLTVCDTKTKITYCYMWHEAEGGRSANAIASCLLRHILQYVPDGVERLVLFSDACTSQNRNSHISAMYFVALQEHPSLKSVEHMFLVSGHTHMEPDNKHSVIERYKKTLEKVSVPQEWYDAVKAAGQQNDSDDFPDGKFKVIRMKDNFYDFSSLLKGPLVKREKTVQNEKFSWLDTFVFRYTKERIGIVQVKGSHNPDVLFEDLSFLRVNGKSATLPKLSTLLQKCFTTQQPISAAKKKDLLKLLPFLDAKHHAFYHALTTEETFEDTDPDLPEDE